MREGSVIDARFPPAFFTTTSSLSKYLLRRGIRREKVDARGVGKVYEPIRKVRDGEEPHSVLGTNTFLQ